MHWVDTAWSYARRTRNKPMAIEYGRKLKRLLLISEGGAQKVIKTFRKMKTFSDFHLIPILFTRNVLLQLAVSCFVHSLVEKSRSVCCCFFFNSTASTSPVLSSLPRLRRLVPTQVRCLLNSPQTFCNSFASTLSCLSLSTLTRIWG